MSHLPSKSIRCSIIDLPRRIGHRNGKTRQDPPPINDPAGTQPAAGNAAHPRIPAGRVELELVQAPATSRAPESGPGQLEFELELELELELEFEFEIVG